MHPDLFGLAFGAPLPTGILEVSDKLLLLLPAARIRA
jgi:hypothetical protein